MFTVKMLFVVILAFISGVDAQTSSPSGSSNSASLGLRDSYCALEYDPSYMTGHRGRIAAYFWLIIHTTIFIPSIIWYIYLSRKPQFVMRSPLMSIIGTIGSYIFSLFVMLELIIRVVWGATDEYRIVSGVPTGWNASLAVLAYVIFITIGMLSYPLRAIRTMILFKGSIFRFGHHRSLREVSQSVDENDSPSVVSIIKKKLTIFLFSEYLYLLIILVVIIGLFVYGRPSWTFECQDFNVGYFMVNILIIGYGVTGVITIVTVLLLCGVSREMTLNTELFTIVGATIVLIPIWMGMAYRDASPTHHLAVPPPFILSSYTIVCLLATIVWPIIHYYQSPKVLEEVVQRVKAKNDVGVTLTATINDEEAKDVFYQQMTQQGQWAYDFISDVKRCLFSLRIPVHSDQQLTQLRDKIHLLSTTYIEEGAPKRLELTELTGSNRWDWNPQLDTIEKIAQVSEQLTHFQEEVMHHLELEFKQFTSTETCHNLRDKYYDPSFKGLERAGIKMIELIPVVHRPPSQHSDQMIEVLQKEVSSDSSTETHSSETEPGSVSISPSLEKDRRDQRSQTIAEPDRNRSHDDIPLQNFLEDRPRASSMTMSVVEPIVHSRKTQKHCSRRKHSHRGQKKEDESEIPEVVQDTNDKTKVPELSDPEISETKCQAPMTMINDDVSISTAQGGVEQHPTVFVIHRDDPFQLESTPRGPKEPHGSKESHRAKIRGRSISKQIPKGNQPKSDPPMIMQQVQITYHTPPTL